METKSLTRNFGINGLDDTSVTILAENNEIGKSENTIAVNNDENDEQTKILDIDELAIQIAPGEGLQPRSILYDNDCEELTFLKIYGCFKFQP
ncbi:unnamed protein product [Brachionus calyciflorus]|uniref:Uncharacterized protein n=1 Tax=Brachionus calyciflorus TaxID=104777 RepID=A0A813W564_9BILA|nr:unnamed protein product [Brachionus calyciflorus]